jgi:flavin reductase (DIM6/NTAB) family NADH-FMN oxidoreductase RutF/riboflavin biosynthesis pyrimidine reductase
VILVGAQTVRAEGYGPPKMPEERQAERVARGQQPVPRIAIVTSSFDLDWSSRLFTESPTRPIVLTTADAEVPAEARAVADIIVAGEGRVSMPGALAAMSAHDVGLVLCEGGPTLNGVLAADDLIDELCLTVYPALVGGDVGTGILGHTHLEDLLPMEVVHAFQGDDAGDVLFRFRRAGDARRTTLAAPVGEALGPDDPGTVDAFNQIMGDREIPMIIVTASDGRERSGCLAGFHAQASIDPPRYMVWISKKNHTHRVARGAEVLAVHFPSAEQRELAVLFGTKTGDEIDKFAECPWHGGPGDATIVDAIERWFVGRISETMDCGDHVGFLLEPLEGEAGPWPGGQLGFQAVKDLEPGHQA